MKKIIAWTLISTASIFVVAQFIRPETANPPSDPKHSILSDTTVPPGILATFQRSCFDCHSNETKWPWYSYITPVNFLIAKDVSEGRRHLNFSDWGMLKMGRKLSLLEEIYDQTSHKEMPLPRYLPLHPNAKLSEADAKAILDWTDSAQERLSNPQ